MSSDTLRRAAVDVGSNTTRLLVADIARDRIEAELARDVRVTGLARGFDGKDIAPDSLQRTRATVVEFYKSAFKLNAESITIGFTGVARRAKNISPLLDELNSLARTKALVLPTHLEAKLSAKGVEVVTGKEDFLLTDIGGGSTEVALKAGKKFDFCSFSVGTVDLEERYYARNAVPAGVIRKMTEEVFGKMGGIKKWLSLNLPLFANTATATLCAAVLQNMTEWDSKKVEGYEVSLGGLERMLQELSAIKADERVRKYPILVEREGVFLCGLVVLKCVIEIFSRSSFLVTEGSLLEGLLFLDFS